MVNFEYLLLTKLVKFEIYTHFHIKIYIVQLKNPYVYNNINLKNDIYLLLTNI